MIFHCYIVIIIVDNDSFIVGNYDGLVGEGDLANGKEEIIFVENVLDLIIYDRCAKYQKYRQKFS